MIAPFGIRPKGTLLVRMLPLAQALVRRGHEVSIVAPPVQNPQDAGQRKIYDGVPVVHTAPARFPGSLDWAVALFQLALAERPDVLHLFKPKGYGGLAALLARMMHPQVPLVVDTDDWEGWGGWNDLLSYPRPAKHFFAWQERDLPRRANAVTVASRTLQAQEWGFGVPPERVFYLPNGVEKAVGSRQSAEDSDKEALSSIAHRPFFFYDSFSILIYTRFWEFDVRDIIAALVAIMQQRPEVRLLVVGTGERGEEQDLVRLAQRAGVAHTLDMRGWVEPAAIPELLASADIALVPLDDTLINRARCSAKLLELMTAGLPIVAANVGQTSEYIQHEQSGLLVPPSDPVALACAALRLLADDALRAQLSVASREAVAAFSWERLALIAERVYYIASNV